MAVSLAELMGTAASVTTFASPEAYNLLFGLPEDGGSNARLVTRGSIGPLSFHMKCTEAERAVLLRAVVIGENVRGEDGGRLLAEYYLDHFSKENSDLAIWAIDFCASGLLIQYHRSEDETKASLVSFACRQVPGEELNAEFICQHEASEKVLRLKYRAIYRVEVGYQYTFSVYVDDEEQPRLELSQSLPTS